MTDLLLPYRLDVVPRTRNDAGGYDLVRLSVDTGVKGVPWPVRCRRITLSVPLDRGLPLGPVSVRTRLTPVVGRAQGRRWWINANTADPAVATFALVPENTASFDGTWSIAFTIELDHPVAATAGITEDTAPEAGEFASRAGGVAMTVRDPS